MIADEIAKAASNFKFLVADKAADANQTIKDIYTVFSTNDDDKDRNDGISEAYMVGNQVLGQNFSWGKDLVYRNNTVNYGQRFDISAHGIKASDVGSIRYTWSMDDDDGWNVEMQVYVALANGDVYQVGAHYYNIHGGAKADTINLGW